MLNWLRRLMIGRYGGDQLNNLLVALSFALVVIASLTGLRVLTAIALGFLVVCYFRMFSRNIQARYAENQIFLKLWHPVSGWARSRIARLRDSRTHKYLKCPACKATLRVPRGKGKISVTCPKCTQRFTTKS